MKELGIPLMLASLGLVVACSGGDESSGTDPIGASGANSGGKGSSAGKGGSAGNGGSAGGSAGKGGSAGNGGAAGAGNNAGTGGTAGDGGTAGSGGAAGDGGSAGDGGTAGDGGSAGAGGSGVTIGEACLTCVANSCATEFNTCAGDPGCFACADGDPTTDACKQNANFQAVLACACQPSACGASDCSTECSLLGAGGAGGSAGAGGDGGSAGSGGDAGSGGAGGSPGPTAYQGTALVSGGTVAKSSKYTLVTTTGQAPGGNNVSKSSKYQLRGGLVGVTQP